MIGSRTNQQKRQQAKAKKRERAKRAIPEPRLGGGFLKLEQLRRSRGPLV